MLKLIYKLEQQVGLIWAYLLLFLITWMLQVVIWSFLEVNSHVKRYHKQAMAWPTQWLEPLKTELEAYSDTGYVTPDIGQWYEQQDSAVLSKLIGVGIVGESDKALLGVMTHPRFDNLNVLTNSHQEPLSVISAVYPESGLSTVFYGIDLARLQTMPIPAEAERKMAILYAEDRYFILVVPTQGSSDKRLFVYDLDVLFSEYLDQQFWGRAQFIERNSLYNEALLLDQLSHNLTLSEHTFNLNELSIPVQYQVQIPVLLEHLDWVKVSYRATFTSLVLFVFLFFYDRLERRSQRHQD